MKYILVLTCLFFTGCFTLPLFNKNSEQDFDRQVVVFQDLLNQGWDLHVVRGKVVLIKQVGTELIVNDVFQVLDDSNPWLN